MDPAYDQYESDFGKVIDRKTFRQYLETDDSVDDNFSKNVTNDFIQQLDETIEEMRDALAERSLERLKKLGNLLVGSSTVIGAYKLKASSRVIEAYSYSVDSDGKKIDNNDALARIGVEIPVLKEQAEEFKRVVHLYYEYYKVFD